MHGYIKSTLIMVVSGFHWCVLSYLISTKVEF